MRGVPSEEFCLIFLLGFGLLLVRAGLLLGQPVFFLLRTFGVRGGAVGEEDARDDGFPDDPRCFKGIAG